MTAAPSHLTTPYVPVLHEGDVVPDAALVDQSGRRFSLVRDGRVSVVSFAYTRCPDPKMCALVTTKFASLQRILSPTNVRLVEITLDPAHDRPGVLRAYGRAVGAEPARWLFGTGGERELGELSQRFGIVRDGRLPAQRHSEAVAILSGDGVLEVLVPGADWNADDVAARARSAAGLASNPLQRAALRLFASASAICGAAGSGGLSLGASFGIFGALALSLGWLAVRAFATTFPGGR